MTEMGWVCEWRIENFKHWIAEVHGECIKSPKFPIGYFKQMELYPKFISGKRKHLVVRLCDIFHHYAFSGELSYYGPDGSWLCSKQPLNADGKKRVLEFPPGPEFEDVLSEILENPLGEDFITVRIQLKNVSSDFFRRVCTTINVLKISLEINPKWIKEMNSDETKDFFYIQLSPNDKLDKIWLKICSKNNTVHFTITPPTEIENPFAVEMSLEGGWGRWKEHVFRNNSPWKFPDSLQKKELVRGGIPLFFRLITKNFIKGPFHMNCAHSCVSIEENNTICFSEKAPSTDPVTSDMPDDSVQVLSKELMCLYQDQDFSDITLKGDNVSFPVHRNILSARSPVFKTMLSTDMKESASGEVDIGDLDPSTLSRFLTYLYTGVVEDLQDDSALKLYYAADKYQVPSLKRECRDFLCSNVSISNVCDILSLADRHGDDQLTSVAQEFILDNFNAVLKSKEWASFMCRESLLAVKTVTQFAAKDSVRKHDSI